MIIISTTFCDSGASACYCKSRIRIEKVTKKLQRESDRGVSGSVTRGGPESPKVLNARIYNNHNDKRVIEKNRDIHI